MYRIYITYTIYDERTRCHREQITDLYRNRQLTRAGAQRILRKDNPTANVIRIETFLYE